ncbi:MAG: DUF4340 domain-containing protein [Chitinophagaceae bacterium]|nr:DUF4340 domain-containing protein [Anaerolineae bacterium]
MKINSRNQILTAILVLQIVFVAFLIFRNSGSSGATEADGFLVSDLAIDQVNEITVRDSLNELVFAKNTDGTWVLRSGGDYPVDNAKIAGLLGAISGLQANRLIAQNVSSHNRLQVSDDNFSRVVELQTGDRTDTIYVGSAAGANATHMRLNDQPEVYLTSGLASFDIPTGVTAWIDAVYFSAPQENILRIKVENANGTFEFVKQNDIWTMLNLAEGETFNPNGFTSILNQISNLRMNAPLGTEVQESYGLSEPTATVTITVQEEVASPDEGTPEPAATAVTQFVTNTYVLLIGSQLESSDFVAKISSSDYYVALSVGGSGVFRTLNREGVIIVAPEATGEATPEFTAEATIEITAEATVVPFNTPESTPEATPTEEATDTP